MKRIFSILAVALLAPTLHAASGAANQILIEQVNAAGTRNEQRKVTPVAGQVLGFDAQLQPVMLALTGGGGGSYTFTPSDFNESGSTVSIDYVNGQAASAATKGFLTAADWSLFNAKLGTSAIGSTVQAYSAILAGTTASFTTALETKLAGIQTGAQVNAALASQAEAEAGTDNTKTMTPLRVAQAISALGGGGSGITDGDKGDITISGGGTVYSIDPDPVILRPNVAVASFAIDVTKERNEHTVTAAHTFTKSAATATGQKWGLVLIGDFVDRVITIPSSYSVAKQATITSFTLKAGSRLELSWVDNGSDDWLIGDPFTIVDLAIATPATDSAVPIGAAGADGKTTIASILALGSTSYEPLRTTVSQTDAEAGTSTDVKAWTPQRVKQAIEALAPAGGGSGAPTGVGDLWPTANIASPPSGYFAAGEYGTTANTALGDWSIIVRSAGTVADPTPSTPPGAVAAGTVITLSSTTPGAFFTSTNNGTDPTYTVGTAGNTFTVSEAGTWEVRANKQGYVSSSVQSLAYTISGGGGGSAAWTHSTDVSSVDANEHLSLESFYWQPITVAGGTVSKLSVYIPALDYPSNLKIALYDGVTAGANLLQQGVVNVSAAGEAELTITNTSISAGTYVVGWMVENYASLKHGYDQGTPSGLVNYTTSYPYAGGPPVALPAPSESAASFNRTFRVGVFVTP